MKDNVKKLINSLGKDYLVKRASEIQQEEIIRTGVYPLDYVLDGGIRFCEGGHKIEFYGADSTGATEPTWELFPGFSNMLDTNADGYGDVVIDTSKNNGLPNKRVRPSLEDEFLEYEYEVTDLSEFTSFQIKIVFSGTNEAKAPVLDNIRALALS